MKSIITHIRSRAAVTVFSPLFLSSILTFSTFAFAADETSDGDIVAVNKCLKAWNNHPFGQKPEYKTIKPGVKVLGIGKSLAEDQETPAPALVLVKPSVSVMSKMRYRLMNPNGWYCLKTSTTVLAKTEITAHCKAHLASAGDGATILGTSSDEKGVTVLGSTVVKIEGEGCPNTKEK